MAKIRLNPINRHVGGVTNFSYGVGIEKRAIQLSPEKAAERIEKLNKSIEKWESISESLNSVVKGFKTACFATSAALQVKNLFSNLGDIHYKRGRETRNNSKVFLATAYGNLRPKNEIKYIDFWKAGCKLDVAESTEGIIKKYLKEYRK